MSQPVPDQALMSSAAQGDDDAFRTLVQRHLPRAYAIASRMLDTRADAEDAVQESFTKLWINAPRWEPGRAAFATWMYRIVANTCLDAARRKRPETGIETGLDTLPDGAPHAEGQTMKDQAARHVREAVQALPAQQRLAVTLCYFEEFTNPEAAQIMGLQLKALEGLLVRARRRLRQTLPR